MFPFPDAKTCDWARGYDLLPFDASFLFLFRETKTGRADLPLCPEFLGGATPPSI
jgi:hypothetical protein